MVALCRSTGARRTGPRNESLVRRISRLTKVSYIHEYSVNTTREGDGDDFELCEDSGNPVCAAFPAGQDSARRRWALVLLLRADGDHCGGADCEHGCAVRVSGEQRGFPAGDGAGAIDLPRGRSEEGGLLAGLQRGGARAIPGGRAAKAAGAADEERAGGDAGCNKENDSARGVDGRDGDWRGGGGGAEEFNRNREPGRGDSGPRAAFDQANAGDGQGAGGGGARGAAAEVGRGDLRAAQRGSGAGAAHQGERAEHGDRGRGEEAADSRGADGGGYRDRRAAGAVDRPEGGQRTQGRRQPGLRAGGDDEGD